MFGSIKKEIILGTMVGEDKREYVAIRNGENLVIHVKANKDDIYKINNYPGDCWINVSFMNYSDDVMENFERKINNNDNEELLKFISKFIYHYGETVIVNNTYDKFIKDKILFKYILEVVSENTGEKTYKWKE